MLNLEKSAEVVLNLTKDQGIEGQRAKVKFVVDYSGSMSQLYSNGTVQRIMERLVPVSMIFDPSQELEMWLFDDDYYKIPKLITPSNVAGFVNNAIKGRSMGSTNYAPIIDAIANAEIPFINKIVPRTKTIEKPAKGFWGRLFGSTVEETVEYNDYVKVRSEGSGSSAIPTLVIFITDGENDDRREAIRAITKASKLPIFFQFVGIKSSYSCGFSFLRELDEMDGRYIDNANFFEMTVRDLTDASDEELYSRILNEFGNSYIPLAKSDQYRLIA